MCGYGSTAQADCKAGLTKTPIAEGVRHSKLVASGTCEVVSDRIEMFDKKWNKWLEAEKIGEIYKLTVKGTNDRKKRIEECQGNCAPGGCPQ